MAIKKYYANKDNTITNAFELNLTTRATGANMGLSDILETFSIYGQASSTSTELERILIEFPVSQISQDRTNGLIPESGSVSFYLNMYNAVHNQTTPRELELVVLPISSSWEEGTGLDMDEYQDVTRNGEGSNWINAAANTPWLREGGDYLSSPIYSQVFPIGNENLNVDITNLVEEWIAGTIPNYGVGVHLTSSQEAYYARYYPREAVDFDGQAFLSGTAPDNISQASSLSMWINQEDQSTTRYMAFWQQAGFASLGRALYVNSAGKVIYVRLYDTGSTTMVSDDAVPLDTWTHLAVTHDQPVAANVPTLYINGVSSSVAFSSLGTGNPRGNFDMFAIGGSRAGAANNFIGLIDDVAYFDKVLSDSEVTELYNSGCPVDIKQTSAYGSLSNWWVHGDDPRDEINLGAPPTEVSIFDRAGTRNLFATGSGDMTIVTGACSGQNGVVPRDSNEIINTNGATESYYTKKFFGRGSEFFFKRPTIEAVWDSSIKDDRGNFYASSSLLPASENERTIYLYNAIGGRLRDIPGATTLGVRVFTSASGGDQISTGLITAGKVSTGIYSASFALDTTASVVYDRWFNTGFTTCYHTGTIEIKTHQASGYSPYPNYVTNLTNLRPIYYTHETNRFRFYVRQKDWSPTIYTVATARNDTLIIESGSYQIHRLTDDLIAIPYNTGSDKGTEMSFDVSGNYFDLKMDLLEPGHSYGIKVAYSEETVNSYVEQPFMWKFRVEEV
jgi:hypothetical protein